MSNTLNKYWCEYCGQVISDDEELENIPPENGDQAHVLGIENEGMVIGERYRHKKCGREVKKLEEPSTTERMEQECANCNHKRHLHLMHRIEDGEPFPIGRSCNIGGCDCKEYTEQED
jgi:DNA-directed RNA polymerase subunit RPC12/RpoP